VRRGISEHIRSNVVGYVALFLVLSGGTAYALDGSNTVFSDDIVDNEVKTQDIGDRNVRTADIGTDAVITGKIEDGAVSTGKLADGAVTEPKLGCAGNNPDDVMVQVGPVCVDRYEASIWDAPTGGNQITGEIPCNANGEDCTDIYARSVPGVKPKTHLNWLQARQVLANSGKRLPTNAEWQMAVAGTPDSTDCNVSTGSLANTGANAACVSNWGTNDMVGNLGEWVADWDERAFAGVAWPAGYGDDQTNLGRASGEPSIRYPAALTRGGDFNDGRKAGPFKVGAAHQPWRGAPVFGFRGVR
jgi:hypothetical protein